MRSMGAAYTAFTAGLLCIVTSAFRGSASIVQRLRDAPAGDSGDRIRIRSVDVLPVLWGGSLSVVSDLERHPADSEGSGVGFAP